MPVTGNKDARDHDFLKGNFGLWYNKYIPLCDEGSKDAFKPCGRNGDKEGAVAYYCDMYGRLKQNAGTLIEKKQRDQSAYLKSMERRFAVLQFSAVLSSRLITGLGQSHPCETSIVLDHTTGVPYIPASTLKGIVRLGCTIEVINDDNYSSGEFYGEDKNGRFLREEKTPVRELFGYQDDSDDGKLTTSGGVVFLDAYPAEPPSITADIINPHYSKYYQEKIPPADNQDPVPVKFIAVEKGAVFVFRMLIENDSANHIELLKNGIERALYVEGIGAKTAAGYGRFSSIKWGEPQAGAGKSLSKGSAVLQEPTVEIKEGDSVKAAVLGVLADKSGIQVKLPNNQNASIGKKQLPGELKNDMKACFKEGAVVKVKVLKISSGSVQLEFQGFDGE